MYPENRFALVARAIDHICTHLAEHPLYRDEVATSVNTFDDYYDVALREPAALCGGQIADDFFDDVLGVVDHPPAKGGCGAQRFGDNQPVGLMERGSTIGEALGNEVKNVMRSINLRNFTTDYADFLKNNALIGVSLGMFRNAEIEHFVQWRRVLGSCDFSSRI